MYLILYVCIIKQRVNNEIIPKHWLLPIDRVCLEAILLHHKVTYLEIAVIWDNFIYKVKSNTEENEWDHWQCVCVLAVIPLQHKTTNFFCSLSIHDQIGDSCKNPHFWNICNWAEIFQYFMWRKSLILCKVTERLLLVFVQAHHHHCPKWGEVTLKYSEYIIPRRPRQNS